MTTGINDSNGNPMFVYDHSKSDRENLMDCFYAAQRCDNYDQQKFMCDGWAY